MIRCTFHLNGGALSILSCPGVGFFPAYSGNTSLHRNNPASVAFVNIGPLPKGKYYIVDRPIGGLLGIPNTAIKSMFSWSNHFRWFGLFRDDGSLDDTTFIRHVQRGAFRLHPAGLRGISEGCITLESGDHFDILHDALLNTAKVQVTSSLAAYGTIQVY